MVSASTAAAGLTALIIIYALFKRLTRPTLSMIRGPKSSSFIIGNLLELFQRPVGEADFAWQTRYGNVVRFKSVLGEDRLLVADPKALHKMLHSPTYNFAKLHNYRVVARLMNGEGLLWADGEVHKRQRSIMLPGFGLKECRTFLPIFRDCAEAISMRWLDTIGSETAKGVVIDVLPWVSRGALDAIGHAAFDVQFGAIQDDLHPLANKYKNFLGDVFGLPSAQQIFMQAASKYFPMWMFQWMLDNAPGPRLARVRDVKVTVTSLAKDLVREKADAILQGKGNTDILTLLIRANMDANAKKRLSDEELIAQMRTLLIAGHETTSTAIAWVLLELARNPGVQARLRDEIRKTEAAANARGDSQLTFTDLETMPYLNAMIREALRFHPPAPHTLRIARQDDLLPLSKPIFTKSGHAISEILIPKGTEIVISIAAYNRDKDLWGEDAHVFRPSRWLDGTIDDRKMPGIGVFSNLMTFFSGVRGCIGWRFALVEMQVFLSTMVGKFEFGLTDNAERIVRQPLMVMAPMIDGELDRGVQLPLKVSLASQDGEN